MKKWREENENPLQQLSKLWFLMLLGEAYYMYYTHCKTKASPNNVPTMSYVFSYFCLKFQTLELEFHTLHK
jgi:hypothetical protein